MKNDNKIIEEIQGLIEKKLIEEDVFPTLDFDADENIEINIDPD